MAKFSVVTACRNAERYIEETVESVLVQTVFRSGRCELEYLVCDGASTDGTLEILRRFEDRGVRIVSQSDAGFYDALAKGLQRATGDYVAYLNAGDMLHPAGLGIAADCFELPGVDWITGYAAIYNERSQLTRCWLPYRYRREMFACGAYGSLLPFLQQESTVWRRALHEQVDFEFLARLAFAGDAFLWKCFAQVSQPYVVRGLIGGFRVHAGQISERMQEYQDDLRSFSRSPTMYERLQCLVDRALWWAPEQVKMRLPGPGVIAYDMSSAKWRKA